MFPKSFYFLSLTVCLLFISMYVKMQTDKYFTAGKKFKALALLLFQPVVLCDRQVSEWVLLRWWGLNPLLPPPPPLSLRVLGPWHLFDQKSVTGSESAQERIGLDCQSGSGWVARQISCVFVSMYPCTFANHTLADTRKKWCLPSTHRPILLTGFGLLSHSFLLLHHSLFSSDFYSTSPPSPPPPSAEARQVRPSRQKTNPETNERKGK